MRKSLKPLALKNKPQPASTGFPTESYEEYVRNNSHSERWAMAMQQLDASMTQQLQPALAPKISFDPKTGEFYDAQGRQFIMDFDELLLASLDNSYTTAEPPRSIDEEVERLMTGIADLNSKLHHGKEAAI